MDTEKGAVCKWNKPCKRVWLIRTISTTCSLLVYVGVTMYKIGKSGLYGLALNAIDALQKSVKMSLLSGNNGSFRCMFNLVSKTLDWMDFLTVSIAFCIEALVDVWVWLKINNMITKENITSHAKHFGIFLGSISISSWRNFSLLR